ncbi:MAG TPA: trypsin-like peptidase domain-containing protein [Limnochordia bacterium]|nr:trypsin-like peptidase domain-containing protein [Limnochordia bacterium]
MEQGGKKSDKVVALLLGLALVLGVALGLPMGAQIAGRSEGSEGTHGAGLNSQQRILDDEEAVIRAVERVGASIVKISVTQQGHLDSLFGRVPTTQQGLGSGVIVDSRGYILTNHHVVEGADTIHVALPDGRQFRGRLVGSYPDADLAVIHIEGDDLPQAELAQGKELKVGQLVIAIGNPFGLDYSVTTGIISALGRELVVDPERGVALTNLIQTDAAINPGNSGGPLVDREGRVIGINTAVLRASHGLQAQGLGFAIPIDDALSVAGQIIRRGRPPARLGILAGTLTPEIARAVYEATGIPIGAQRGVFVREVHPGSPAQAAGLEPADVIVRAGGRRIESVEELLQRVWEVGPGASLSLVVLRKGRRMTLTAEL